MSRRFLLLALGAGIAAALLLQLVAQQSRSAKHAAGNAPPETLTAAQSPPGEPPPAAAPAIAAEDFRRRLRGFVGEAAALEPARRQQRARTLHSEILARERAGTLLPGESAYLQLTLLRVTIDDAHELRRRSQQLLDEYQAEMDARWQAYRRKPDIRHEAYRAAEAEVVRLALQGDRSVSQAELRQRLQELREQYYADEPLQ